MKRRSRATMKHATAIAIRKTKYLNNIIDKTIEP